MNPASPYVLGVSGPQALVPGRVAAWLDSAAGLSQLRVRSRGLDPEVDAVLLALQVAALAWRTSATGSAVAAEPEEAGPSKQWLSTSEAAGLIGITDRAIRLAIRGGRLQAEQVDGRWRIRREDLEHYRAARAA